MTCTRTLWSIRWRYPMCTRTHDTSAVDSYIRVLYVGVFVDCVVKIATYFHYIIHYIMLCTPSKLSGMLYVLILLPANTVLTAVGIYYSRSRDVLSGVTQKTCLYIYNASLPFTSTNIPLFSRSISYSWRPRWLGRLSSCLLKSTSRVQFSPSAHTRMDFFLRQKLTSGKRESVS